MLVLRVDFWEIWYNRIYMMTSSNGFYALLALYAGNSPITGEFPSRPLCFGVFFDLRLNKRLGKQSWRWWFETPSCSLWRHYNDVIKRQIAFYVNYASHSASFNYNHHNAPDDNLWSKVKTLSSFFFLKQYYLVSEPNGQFLYCSPHSVSCLSLNWYH